MMQHNLLRSVALILLGGAAIASAGCGRDPMTEADAVLGPIKAAVADPTGALGASNAKDVFTGAAMIGLFTSSGYIVPFEGTPSGPPLQGREIWKCLDDLSDDPPSGTTDLECITRGTTTGTQRWTRASKPAARLRVEITEYDDVCSRSGSTCFSGEEALRSDSDSSSTLWGRELTVTLRGGETRVVRSGSYVEFELGSGKGSRVILLAYVIFDDAGRSYTLSALSANITETPAPSEFTEQGDR
jgi:hypothetical protein